MPSNKVPCSACDGTGFTDMDNTSCYCRVCDGLGELAAPGTLRAEIEGEILDKATLAIIRQGLLLSAMTRPFNRELGRVVSLRELVNVAKKFGLHLRREPANEPQTTIAG